MSFKGVLSDLSEELKRKAADKLKAQGENKADCTHTKIATLKNLEQKRSTLLKADFTLRCSLLHALSGDPNVSCEPQMQSQVPSLDSSFSVK